MKIDSIHAETLLYGALAIAGLYAIYKTVNFAGDVASDVGNAINPIDPNNIFNQAANYTWQGLTGSNGSIGGDIYDFTHDSIDNTGKVVPAPVKKLNTGLTYASYASNPVLGLVKGTQAVVTTEYDWLQKQLKSIFN